MFNEFGDFADILGDMFGFGDLFGGGRRRGGPQRGADLRYDLEITFEESAQRHRDHDPDSASGNLRDLQRLGRRARHRRRPPARSAAARARSGSSRASSRSREPARSAAAPAGSITKPCQTCRGAGRVARERKITVKIPAGIATGQQLRLQGEGEAGAAGGPAGHLFVVVHVQEHEFFRRDGLNLFCEMPVNFTTLALGGEIAGADARRHRKA